MADICAICEAVMFAGGICPNCSLGSGYDKRVIAQLESDNATLTANLTACREDLAKAEARIAEVTRERDEAATSEKNIHELLTGNDLAIAWKQAAEERERLRGLLAEACDHLETEGLDETAARLRQQGGAWER